MATIKIERLDRLREKLEQRSWEDMFRQALKGQAGRMRRSYPREWRDPTLVRCRNCNDPRFGELTVIDSNNGLPIETTICQECGYRESENK